jgi:hypothetical protein
MTMPTFADADVKERTCARCEMTTRWIPKSKREKLPSNWVEHKGEPYCLACRRELAVVTALEEAGDAPASGRAKIRSQAVVEFEIRRDPDRRDGDIARAARCSVMAVSKARKRLGLKRTSV